MCTKQAAGQGTTAVPCPSTPAGQESGRDDDSLFITNEADHRSPRSPTPGRCDLSPRLPPDAELDWDQPIGEQELHDLVEDYDSLQDDSEEDDSLEEIIDLRNQYLLESGKGRVGMSHVKSLKDLATRACIRNNAHINTVGQLPYRLVRPILLTIENHEQLHQIELASPQIIGDDAEIWRKLILRHIPGAKDKIIEPTDPANWFKVYKKIKRGEDRDLEAATKALAAGFKAANAPKEAMRAQQVIMVKPPQGTKRGSSMVLGGRPDAPKIFKYNSRTKSNDRFSTMRQVNRPGHIVRDVGMPTVSRSVASSTTGKGMLDRARQEAKIVKTYRKAQPTHLMNHIKNPKSQIKSVPKSMMSSPAPPTATRSEQQQSSHTASASASSNTNARTSTGRPQNFALR